MSRWRSLFRKREMETELDSELRFHIEELTDANIAAGLTPDEARRRAVLEFGGREQIKEELRDVRRVAVVENTLANLKAAARFIRKSPSFSVTVILTLALGIGANSAVFSAIDAILLRPLSFPNADRLVRVDQINPKDPNTFVAALRLVDWSRLNSTFQWISGYYDQNESETTGPLPEKLTRAFAAPRFFETWGVSPALGRGFSAEEERFGGPNAVVISDRFWRRRFNADPGAIGKTLRFGRRTNTIVGVMPASFLFPDRDVDLWSPSPVDAPYAQNRESTWFTVIGRLKPATTLAQARADLSAVQAHLGKAYPKTDGDLRVRIEPLKETTVGGVRRSLWILFGSVSLLLLIACTNIAALLLARASERQREISVRFALGASRATVVGQLLTEAFVLALAGSTLGVAVAAGTSSVFSGLARNLPRVEEIGLDWRIVLYSLVCALAATLACGLFPALYGTRREISGSLAQASRTHAPGRNPLQWMLVGVQVALAVTLLAGAGLLLRSFQALGRVAPGFDPSHVLTFRVSAGWGETGDMNALKQRIDRTLTFLEAVPGVEAAATSADLPGVPGDYQIEMKLGGGSRETDRKIMAQSRWVSTGYFATMRIPLLAGEPCRESASTLCAVLNRSFLDTYLGGASGIGRGLSTTGAFAMRGEIHAIAGDAREAGINHAAVPTVYWCFSAPEPDPHFLVRTRGDPMAMAETLRRKLHEIEPGRAVFDIMPLEEHLGDAFAENRLRTALLALFAMTAVSLASLGLYGTLSYFVTVRRRETGVRLALGAQRSQIVTRFLLEGLGVAALGSLGGLALAIGFTRVLAGMLYGVSPSDATTLAGVVALVLAVAAAASLAPAIRAARVEPTRVLRDE